MRKTPSQLLSGTLSAQTTYWWPTCTMELDYWTLSLYAASLPLVSPVLLPPCSVWPGCPAPLACLSQGVR